MALQVKNFQVLRSLLTSLYHPRLVDVLAWVCGNAPGDVIITSGYRPGDPGVHGAQPCRAVDIRSWVFADPAAFADRINTAWIYDPRRPQYRVCLYHDVGRGPHLHLQAHPNTTKRGEF